MALDLNPVTKLSKVLRESASKLEDHEARFLVNQYYSFQEDRKRTDSRIRFMKQENRPHEILSWISEQSRTVEQQLQISLRKYASAHPVGRWMLAQYGIGSVISAGYLAYIDITKANTAGKIWANCGVAPGKDRKIKGQKITFDPFLKYLTWTTGQMFKRFYKIEECFYGQIYDNRKTYEIEQNANLKYKEQAEKILATKKFDNDTIAKASYMAGKLPPAHIDARAARYAAKIFLSHLHQVWYEWHFGIPAPLPFPIGILGHVDYIKIPHREICSSPKETVNQNVVSTKVPSEPIEKEEYHVSE